MPTPHDTHTQDADDRDREDPHTITLLLRAWSQGDEEALDRLLPLIYGELHRLAEIHLSHEAHHTLQPTELINEAYFKLFGRPLADWRDRQHFFAIASRAMRQVLVDHSRRRRAGKRNGLHLSLEELSFDQLERATAAYDDRLDDRVIALDEALRELEAVDERKSRVVEMRYFVGMSVKEIAAVLGVGPGVVNRDWEFAKAWLLRRINRRK